MAAEREALAKPDPLCRHEIGCIHCRSLAARGYTLSAETSSAYLLGYEAARAAPSSEPLPREALTLALVAEALFEARIGAPADALLLAETLYPVLLRLFASPDRPTPP